MTLLRMEDGSFTWTPWSNLVVAKLFRGVGWGTILLGFLCLGEMFASGLRDGFTAPHCRRLAAAKINVSAWCLMLGYALTLTPSWHLTPLGVPYFKDYRFNYLTCAYTPRLPGPERGLNDRQVVVGWLCSMVYHATVLSGTLVVWVSTLNEAVALSPPELSALLNYLQPSNGTNPKSGADFSQCNGALPSVIIISVCWTLLLASLPIISIPILITCQFIGYCIKKHH